MKLIFLSLLLLPIPAFSQKDTLVVEVIYGSKPLSKEESHWFGGKLGGHIGLRIGQDSVLHFLPGRRVNATNANSDIGRYVISSEKQFYHTFYCDTLKTMQIFIPVDHKQKLELLQSSAPFIQKGPYPYAFFGMRCAAACYHLLSLADVTEKHSKSKMTWKFFYPRKLRKFLLKKATENHWIVKQTAGSRKRKWDHD
ncbi:hypothetical protein [Fluviicola sp.]|uniref:hypothetical protein n=1 Tax=Fluviicola sp. TaxID=1917219 RepID=UPI0031D29DD2